MPLVSIRAVLGLAGEVEEGCGRHKELLPWTFCAQVELARLHNRRHMSGNVFRGDGSTCMQQSTTDTKIS
jgi:hypothetical protein